MRESRHLEFKENVSNTFLKTVSAFANAIYQLLYQRLNKLRFHASVEWE